MHMNEGNLAKHNVYVKVNILLEPTINSPYQRHNPALLTQSLDSTDAFAKAHAGLRATIEVKTLQMTGERQTCA
jgi:hypothetical protein